MSTSCVSLSNSITPDCAALKRPGGANKRVFLGSVTDLSSVTFDNTDSYNATALAFKTGKQAIEVVGKKAKNTGGASFEEGENLTVRNHSVTVITYPKTAAHRKALDEIISQDQVFAVVERLDGEFELFGLSTANYESWGMKVTGGSYEIGIEVNDMNGYTLEFTGEMLNVPIVFGEGKTYAENVTDLVALLTPAV